MEMGEGVRMLEFKPGFFEQEIRDGFYIDTAMKSVWAASMEVLQRVAEVCDRHGIEWYAAYGTLLGAIRHEGFIPWDDDVDIWVKREGYNKLVQILPRELPEGYLVKSALTRGGYREFQMFVQNAEYIHTDQEWLKQYHGCPFMVGVDIFPLDYLPRQEEERITQEKLIAIATRAAQVVIYIIEGKYEEAEDPAEEKKAYMEEIWEGIRYLEANCGAQIDHQPFLEEKWPQAASELQKWANYIAMMYGETEGDYLVNFIDYVRWQDKIFPKEWFAETYSATFENFMLPIPCGYEQILCRNYGDYRTAVRGDAQHDYPHYSAQLREVGKMIRGQEKLAQQLGLAVSPEAVIIQEDISLPPAWESLVNKTGGARKKVVLFANDISVFLTYRGKALDKLEQVLRIFEEVREQITLWWRPQRLMIEQLEEISAELARRYLHILECYEQAGWGICDKTYNVGRAVELCDAYYGDMNAILQPFQQTGKPIMIAQVEKV